MKIIVIDGQGGALGKSVVIALKKERIDAEIVAIGTNSIATSAMLGAGADCGATGENPVVVCCADADIIIGPVGIIAADSMMGEVTREMARAVGACGAKKILIPVNKCNIMVVGCAEHAYSDYVKLAVEQVVAEAGSNAKKR